MREDLELVLIFSMITLFVIVSIGWILGLFSNPYKPSTPEENILVKHNYFYRDFAGSDEKSLPAGGYLEISPHDYMKENRAVFLSEKDSWINATVLEYNCTKYTSTNYYNRGTLSFHVKTYPASKIHVWIGGEKMGIVEGMDSFHVAYTGTVTLANLEDSPLNVTYRLRGYDRYKVTLKMWLNDEGE